MHPGSYATEHIFVNLVLPKGHDTSTNSTQLLNRVGSPELVYICVIDLQLDFFYYSSLIPDRLVGSRPP